MTQPVRTQFGCHIFKQFQSEWRLPMPIHLKKLPDVRRLFSFRKLSDFVPWMISTDKDIKGSTVAEMEFSPNKTMIFRGNIGPDPDGGYDPYGAAILYCEAFDPPMDLDNYEYVVWRLRELPPQELVSEMPPDDPRIAGFGNLKIRRGNVDMTDFYDETPEQKIDRLKYLFDNEDDDSALASSPSSDSTSTKANESSSPSSSSFPSPHSFQYYAEKTSQTWSKKALSVMSSLLTIPLPLSHSTFPFMRPNEALFKYSPTASIFASLAPDNSARSPLAPIKQSTTTSSDHPSTTETEKVEFPPPNANPFDPSFSGNHWLYDGREVWMVVETQTGSNKMMSQMFSPAPNLITSDNMRVHAHPVLLPSPSLLKRARIPGSDNFHEVADANLSHVDTSSNLLESPHARSMLWQPLRSELGPRGKRTPKGLIPESEPVPEDGRAVPGRPFINVVVPIYHLSRRSWPNVMSPDKPWYALLSTALPKTSEGNPIFATQREYLQYSYDLRSQFVTRLGIAIPYMQPGPFAIEVESISLVKGNAAEQVYPNKRPM